jgi:hypothetical protein
MKKKFPSGAPEFPGIFKKVIVLQTFKEGILM